MARKLHLWSILIPTPRATIDGTECITNIWMETPQEKEEKEGKEEEQKKEEEIANIVSTKSLLMIVKQIHREKFQRQTLS